MLEVILFIKLKLVVYHCEGLLWIRLTRVQTNIWHLILVNCLTLYGLVWSIATEEQSCQWIVYLAILWEYSCEDEETFNYMVILWKNGLSHLHLSCTVFQLEDNKNFIAYPWIHGINCKRERVSFKAKLVLQRYSRLWAYEHQVCVGKSFQLFSPFIEGVFW